MDFLKKHYEKLVLVLVLLGLLAVALWLPVAIAQEKERIDLLVQINADPKKVAPINLTTNEAVFARVKTPPAVDFSTPHRLFNPVMWKQRPDGSILKIDSEDKVLPTAVVKPLFFMIAFDRVAASTAGASYYFGITREAASRPADRKKIQRYVSTSSPKTEFFTLLEVKGAADSPAEWVLELAEAKEKVSVTPDAPYKKEAGYAADLRLEAENKSFADQRVGSVLFLGGEKYKIIAITENEVTLQADLNKKKLVIRAKPQ